MREIRSIMGSIDAIPKAGWYQALGLNRRSDRVF